MPKDKIIAFIDSFYPLFKKLMPLQTFRYAVCGGSNTVLGLTVFTFFHEVVFKGKVFEFNFFALKPHTASNTISFIVTLIVGFLLLKYVVFAESCQLATLAASQSKTVKLKSEAHSDRG